MPSHPLGGLLKKITIALLGLCFYFDFKKNNASPLLQLILHLFLRRAIFIKNLDDERKRSDRNIQ